MMDKTKKTLQIVLVIVVVFVLLVWWALYRLGVFSGPSQQRQTEIINNFDKSNNDFLQLLEKNAKFLSSSTPSTSTTGVIINDNVSTSTSPTLK